MRYIHLCLSLVDDEIMPACGCNVIEGGRIKSGTRLISIESPLSCIAEELTCRRCKIAMIAISEGASVAQAQNIAENDTIPSWCFLLPSEWQKIEVAV